MYTKNHSKENAVFKALILCNSTGNTEWKLTKSLSVVKMGIRWRIEIVHNRKSVLEPFMPFFRAVLKYSAANS